jgi:hypothetical protein
MPHPPPALDAPVPTPGARLRAAALWGAAVGTLGIAVAYLSAFAPPPVAAWGPWLMAVALPVTMVAIMVLGVARDDRRLGRLAGGFLLALGLPADRTDGPLWLGLPPRAAVILYGVGLLPLFILPVAYAMTFDALTLDDADLARVRAAREPEGRS